MKRNALFIIIAAAYMALYYAVLLLDESLVKVPGPLGNAISLLGILIAFAASIATFLRSRHWLKKHSTHVFWLAFLAGLGCYVALEIYRSFTRPAMDTITFPGPIDYLYLAYYLLMLLGMVYTMATGKMKIHIKEFKLNVLLIGTSIGTMAWFHIDRVFSISEGLPDAATIAVSIAYIVGAPLLTLLVFLMFTSMKNLFPQETYYLMLVSFVILIVPDLVYMYSGTFGHAIPWSVISPVWILAALLLALSFRLFAQNPRSGERLNAKTKLQIHLVSHLFSYAFAFLLYIFLLWVLLPPSNQGRGAIPVAGLFTVVLLAVFAVHIKRSYALEKTLLEVQRLNEDLEMRVKERTRHLDGRNKELKVLLQKINHHAYHDDLTGLPNRKYFMEKLEAALEAGATFAVLFIDLDRFKPINDSFGHDVGDRILVEAAARLRDCLREQDTVARFGGDEFILLLEEADAKAAIRVSDRIIRAFSKPFTIQGEKLHTSPSIGISRFPEDGRIGEELVKNADIAMYLAKEKGKNNYRFFASEA